MYEVRSIIFSQDTFKKYTIKLSILKYVFEYLLQKKKYLSTNTNNFKKYLQKF